MFSPSFENCSRSIVSTFSPPFVDRIWGTWGSYYNIPKAIFHLLEGTIPFGSRHYEADLLKQESFQVGESWDLVLPPYEYHMSLI